MNKRGAFKIKEIKLTNGMICEIDDEDYDKVKDYKWTYNGRYAVANIKSKTTNMHRLIIMYYKEIPKEQIIDHIDGNGINNKKDNLRICSQSNNQMNKSKTSSKTTSKYKGVCFDRNHGKWNACLEKTIHTKRKKFNLGLFESELEASIVYDINAIILFGEYAKTNHSRDNYKDISSYENYIKIGKPKKKTSKYKYIYWMGNINKWAAEIQYKKVKHRIGFFKDEKEAAINVNKYIITNNLERKLLEIE